MLDELNRVIEGEKVILHSPKPNELWYRTNLYNDPETMSFTNDCKHEIDSWPPSNDQQLKEWYVMNNSNMSNFYSYVVDKETKVPVGEISIYYHSKFNKYMIHLIIEKQYRNKGYGTDAIRSLLEYVFKVMNLDAVYEISESSRLEVNNLFKKVGFDVSDDNEELLWMTKREYNAKN